MVDYQKIASFPTGTFYGFSIISVMWIPVISDYSIDSKELKKKIITEVTALKILYPNNVFEIELNEYKKDQYVGIKLVKNLINKKE